MGVVLGAGSDLFAHSVFSALNVFPIVDRVEQTTRDSVTCEL